jgi:hypothetical protein
MLMLGLAGVAAGSGMGGVEMVRHRHACGRYASVAWPLHRLTGGMSVDGRTRFDGRPISCENNSPHAVTILPDQAFHGAVAQLGERVNRTHEVRGSTPLSSTLLTFDPLGSNPKGSLRGRSGSRYNCRFCITCRVNGVMYSLKRALAQDITPYTIHMPYRRFAI